jgi:phosphoglycolate phosphatase
MALALLSFDLDGTLVDTAAEIAEAVNRTLADLRQPRRPLDEITLLIGRGSHALMRAVLAGVPAAPGASGTPGAPGASGLFPLPPEDEILDRFDDHYADTTGTFSRPYDGAHAALNRLQSHGVRLACVTNKEIAHARRLLQRHDLHRFFELVIGGDSLPQAKPHASVLRYVADTLGVARDDMAHVGDSEVDVMAARHAGVRAWALPHGYNAGRPIAETHPDLLLPDLAAVAEAALFPSLRRHSPTTRSIA